jgi:protease-4
MKQFFKFLFASMLGFMLGAIVLFFLFIAIISAVISSSGDKEISIADKTILHIRLNQPLRDRSSSNPFDSFDFMSLKSKKQQSVKEITEEIERAANDKSIKGIFLDVPFITGAPALVEEIRNAILKFRKSGKPVLAYADFYSQGGYYLASAADSIFVNPQGAVTMNGLSSQLMFFKGTLEKLEIKPQVIRHGKYKSAIEPFINDRMSPENREQIAGFVNPIWGHMTAAISVARKISPEEIELIADSLKSRNANDALALKLVDGVIYYDEFIARLNKLTGTETTSKPELVSLNEYVHTSGGKKERGFTKDRIAIIYAEGDIVDGEGDENSVGSVPVSAAIRAARNDKNVKAIVLRVNSPGGSALASDIIWREVVLAKKSKPVIVSMGGLAASGGYYISCAADKIVAQPNTITGSIGVFGLLFNAEDLLKNKLGITVDTYKTGPYTDMGMPTRALTESERLILQTEIDNIYDVFTRRVADGRKMRQSAVDSIAQGRVWAGETALKIGLVDTLGGIDDAIRVAAKMAGIDNYRLRTLPERKEGFQALMEELAAETKTSYLKQTLGEEYKYAEAAEAIRKIRGLQMRSFYSLEY